MIDLPGLISYIVTESDQSDDYIQLEFNTSVPDIMYKGNYITIGGYSGIVRQISTNLSNGQYRSNVVLGTQYILLDTVIPSGHKFEVETAKDALYELFQLTGVNVYILSPHLDVPLQEGQISLQGTTKVTSWLDGLTKIGKSKIYSAYFDLYGNFYLIKPDYTENVVKLSSFEDRIIDINISSTMRTDQPESLVTNSFNDASQSPKILYGQELVNGKLRETKPEVGKKDGRKGVPNIQSTNYEAPTLFGTNTTFEIAGEVGFGLRTLLEIDTGIYPNLIGEYLVRGKVTRYTNSNVVTTLTVSEIELRPKQVIDSAFV